MWECLVISTLVGPRHCVCCGDSCAGVDGMDRWASDPGNILQEDGVSLAFFSKSLTPQFWLGLLPVASSDVLPLGPSE
jgi:hypothetical protein